MKQISTKYLHRTIRLGILLILIANYFPPTCSAQITESIAPVTFYGFNISSEKKNVSGKAFLFVSIFKDNQIILTDSVSTDIKSCTGFSVPLIQPIKGYFIFAKRERHNGKLYILSKTGEWTVIAGGIFWAAPKNKWLFILAERDNTNLLIFNLRTMKTMVEKYNCDEFTGWYYRKGNYMGKVVMECGNEPEPEKEISEWMHPVEVEKFNVKTQTLGESHTTDEDLGRSKALVRYAACK